MALHRIQFKDLEGSEGLVFLGCGADLDEWTNGIKLMLDAPAEVQEDVVVIDGDKDDDEVEVEIEIEVDEAENKQATRTATATKRTLRPQNSQSLNIPARRPKRRLFVQE